ncbi:MAG: 50S ribosomal protein L29 [Candidatus Aenigmarchaeota archaeon]|nr:50S ribosomal protein L29 [Candidatus Aenigmarchaeota archaeon]
MAAMKKKQLKELNDDDLKARLNELRLELSKGRAQIAVGGSPENTGRIRQTRKTIARILTEMKRRL